jgi:uncharacterized protein
MGWAVLAIAGLYIVLLAAMYLAQRSLIFPAPKTFPAVPAGYQRVTFQTADELDLAGIWRAPRPGRPVVLFFHGNGDSWSGGATAMSGLAKAGYGVFLPEYRGYGGNPGKPTEQGLYLDSRAALAWLKAGGFAPGQVLLVGNSIGGGLATQLAIETKPAALILVALLIRDHFDNGAKINQVAAPILILHGTADGLIPHSHSERLAQINPRAKLVLVPGVGHELAYGPQAQLAELDWLAGL